MTNKIKIILFDIDDTLYDYQKHLQMLADKAAFSVLEPKHSEASKLYRKAKENLKLLYATKQITHNQFYDRKTRYSILLELMDIKNKSLAIKMDNAFWKAIKENIKPFKNSKKVLSDLKKFYTLGVVTNGLKCQQHLKLKNMGLTDFFDYVFTSEDAGIEKPNKEFFEHVLKKLGAQNHECILVGNDPIDDIVGAKSIGMKTIFYGNKTDLKGITSDYMINDILQLENILL